MNEQLQSPLFHLPPELRQLIYYHALTSSAAIIDVTKFNKDNRDATAPHIAWKYPVLGLSLPQTCRRIHHELDISPFYANNRFTFTQAYKVHKFLQSLYDLGRVGLLSELSFDMRYATNLPEPGDSLPEVGTVDRRWRSPLRLPGPAPGTINPEWDTPRGSEFADWEHYLCCTARLENHTGGLLCTVTWYGPDDDNGYSCNTRDHFVDAVSAMNGLRTLVVDFVEMRRNMLRTAEGRNEVWGKVLERFIDLFLLLVTTGVEIRVRMLNSRREVVDGIVCAAADEETSLAILEGREGSSGVKKWTWKDMRMLLEEVCWPKFEERVADHKVLDIGSLGFEA